jgi:hypothetical protein
MYRLTGTFTLLSPLSHIGESISTNSYLVQEPILQPNGELEEVFCYSGNAWRGQLRDLCAGYMLDKLQTRVPLDAFHLLFSGGKIGGDQKVDIERIRTLRQIIPMLSLFGGGLGNQIMPGKLRVSNCYPVCQETAHLLPDDYAAAANAVSYRRLTMEKSFSRKDDSKNDNLLPHLAEMDLPLLEGKSKKSDEVNTQMRMTSELVIAGTQLYTSIDILDGTELELGALVSAIHRFADSPHIGGQANRGHGRALLDYRLLDTATGEVRDFIRIKHDVTRLSHHAQAAKDAYDQHLREQYDRMLEAKGGEIVQLLGGG